MFRRKKKDDEPTETPAAPAQTEGAQSEAFAEPAAEAVTETATAAPAESNTAAVGGDSKAMTGKRRGNRVQKVGTVSSDKMQKTVVVRVDRLVLHR